MGGAVCNNPLEVESILTEILTSGELEYRARPAAEKDPSWKQIIPYVVIVRGREVFKYKRTKKAGDSRLHDLWSVGVGGHINPVDGEGEVAYEAAFWRELEEEVGLTRGVVQYEKKIGLIYDDSNEVGQVHFGICHAVKIDFTTTMTFKDPALADGQFCPAYELKRTSDAFENWSKLVIDHLLA